MELALEEGAIFIALSVPCLCFNPCYYGIGFRSFPICSKSGSYSGFNPCYYGIGFRRCGTTVKQDG